jgi:hypothetical protein
VADPLLPQGVVLHSQSDVVTQSALLMRSMRDELRLYRLHHAAAMRRREDSMQQHSTPLYDVIMRSASLCV